MKIMTNSAKSKAKLFTSALTVLALIAGFQNCSTKVKFGSSSPDQSVKLLSVSVKCTDADGDHESGSTWTKVSSLLTVVQCVDAADSQQGYSNTDSFLCLDGVISQSGSDSVLSPPMASCPAPNLTVSLSNSAPQSGGNTNLIVNSQVLHDLSYTCTKVADGGVFSTGLLPVGSASAALSNINQDLSCTVTGQHLADALAKTVAVTLDCESSGKLKDPTTHQCVDFQCSRYLTLAAAADGSYDVPARTVAGACYSVKLMNSIANSTSNLTTNIDGDLISRNHDINPHTFHDQHNPYLMDKKLLSFIMRKGGGARAVKLSSSGSTDRSIKVDNFLAIGLAPTTLGLSDVAQYRAYGTQDSTVDAEQGTYVLFKNSPLPLQSFGAIGTSTITALDITTQVSTEAYYSLDVRALDCGGARELSDIYLIFQ